MKSFAAASQPIGVLVADSNRMQAQLLTSALRRRSGFRVTLCPLDSALILQSANSRPPGVVLLSMNAATDAAEAITMVHRFHRSHPLIPKILLVESFDRDLVVSAFRSGVRGIFSLTDSNLRLLCKCISRVAAGQVWANSEQLNYILDLVSEVPSLRVLNSLGTNLLTQREEQVVALVAEGLGNRQIAAELNLSKHTIKKYLFRIFEKLSVSSRVELVLYAVNNGDPRHAECLPGGRILPSA
jgi:DNA-binding NarL/FixJ family response regulator